MAAYQDISTKANIVPWLMMKSCTSELRCQKVNKQKLRARSVRPQPRLLIKVLLVTDSQMAALLEATSKIKMLSWLPNQSVVLECL